MANAPAYISALLVLSAVLGLLVPSCTAQNYILYSGENLYSGQSLQYGGYTFTMQTDCNLVLYDNSYPAWSSGTYNYGQNCMLSMQSDGNLVIYSNGRAVWASNTGRQQGYYVLILQRDRNVVIYGGSIWATNTHVGTSGGVVVTQNATSVPPVVVVTQNSTSTAEEPKNRKIAMVTQH